MINDNVQEKIRSAIRRYYDKGLTLAPLEPPLNPGRSIYTRHYSYSVLNNILSVYYLGKDEDKEKTCRDLIENARLYQRDKQLRDDRDSYYWGTDLLMFFYHNYLEPEIAAQPTLLNVELKQELLKAMWLWAYDNIWITDTEYEKCRTWYIRESENHHIQRFSTAWAFLQIFLGEANYRDRILEDGVSVKDHFDALEIYIKEWLRQRGRKGLFVESSNGGYNCETLKGVTVIYQFTGDEEMKRLAKNLMDLYWASWATEELNGVRGGAKSRVYPVSSGTKGRDGIFRLAWYYLGVGEPTELAANDLTFLLSDYRIPELIQKLARHPEERGVYESCQRILGRAADENYMPPVYHVDPENGLVRYAYCTPDYIMGGYYMEARPETDWVMISSQNRVRGVIFGNDPDARVMVQCCFREYLYTKDIWHNHWPYNQAWGIQKKNGMIAAALPEPYSENQGNLRIWFHNSCLDNVTEQDGWVFTENTAAGCYIGVKVLQGGARWMEEENGKYLTLDTLESPIILEVASKKEIPSYARFREKCIACAEKMTWDGKKVCYTTVSGEELTFFADRSAIPQVNGRDIELKPDYAFRSPFLNEKWNSGEAKVTFGGEEYEMKF